MIDEEALKRRSEERRERMKTNWAASHEEAEEWDLEFWQSLTPEERLSAHAELVEEAHQVMEDAEEYRSRNNRKHLQ